MREAGDTRVPGCTYLYKYSDIKLLQKVHNGSACYLLT